MPLPDFRELYEQMLEYKGDRAYQDVLLPWRDKADELMSTLKKYGEIQARLIPGKDILHQLWDLYALSRVSDVLLFPFQKSAGDSNLWHGYSWLGTDLTAEQRNAFFISLGMTRIDQKTFHPFFHEIVEVTQSDDPDEPITHEEELWSGFMLGSLLFCRAGVKVRGGRKHIKKEIAENSTLYHTYWHRNRKVCDASSGWGSNSQWNTDFRRDYEGDACYYYNVDAGYDIATLMMYRPGGGDQAMLDESIELLVNRCFILRDKLADDEGPYGGKYREWKTPVPNTEQFREDEIEEKRRREEKKRREEEKK